MRFPCSSTWARATLVLTRDTSLPCFSPGPDFDSAEASFDTVQRLDPYRLDDVDTYSNMLYVIPKLSKLAQLAKEYSNIDRNRAETCALIGASPSALIPSFGAAG